MSRVRGVAASATMMMFSWTCSGSARKPMMPMIAPRYSSTVNRMTTTSNPISHGWRRGG
ncbi:Uncharacterised protein [Mycobacteroides abscessus subsp. abscessus]|nr:Uncharacterised protein [Mycobacteroides abscessus subsp. abscessus]